LVNEAGRWMWEGGEGYSRTTELISCVVRLSFSPLPHSYTHNGDGSPKSYVADGCNYCSWTASAVSVMDMLLSEGEQYIHWHSILEVVLASPLPIARSSSDSLTVPSSLWTTFPNPGCVFWFHKFSFTIPRFCSSPWRCLYFDVVMELAWSNGRESCASSSIPVVGASRTEQVEDECS